MDNLIESDFTAPEMHTNFYDLTIPGFLDLYRINVSL